MLTLGQQKVDVLTLVVLTVFAAGAIALAIPYPQLLPWVVLIPAGAALLIYWSVRGEVTLWAWIWILSYGLLWPNWKLEIPGFFNMTIPRFIFLALLVVFFLHFLLRRAALRFDRAPLWAMLILLVYCGVSATYHGWHARVATPESSAPYFRFLGAFLFPYLVFFCIYNATRSEKQIRRTLVFLSIYGWYALYIAYLQYAAIMGAEGARALIWPGYINDPNFGHHFDRARGAFNASNTQANVLILLFFADLFLIRRLRGPYRAALIVQAVLIPPAIFFTGLRSGYVAFLLAGAVWIIGSVRRGWARWALLSVATLVLVVFTAVFWGNLTRTGEGARKTGGVAQKLPLLPRRVLAQRTAELLAEHPLTGVGFGHYLEHAPMIPTDPGGLAGVPGIVGQRVTPGNLFLVIAAETGLIGVILILAVFVLIFRQSLQLYRRIPPTATGLLSRGFVVVFWVTLVAYLTDAMFVDPFWDVASNGLFWAMAGLVCGYNRLLDPHPIDLLSASPPLEG